MGKCQCHSNPKEPIRDAERAPQNIAEEHEDARERAKEMRRLRATKGSLPQDGEQLSSKKGSVNGRSIKSETPDPQRGTRRPRPYVVDSLPAFVSLSADRQAGPPQIPMQQLQRPNQAAASRQTRSRLCLILLRSDER